MKMSFSVLGLILLSVSLSAIAQISLKHGMSAAATHEAVAAGGLRAVMIVLTNAFVILGLVLYGLGMVFWLGVLSRIDVSQAYPFVGLGFILTMALGVLLLGESFSIQRAVGTLLVLAGVFLVARSG
jgi:multidrug transporter EmrE-like cation transporter